MISPLEKAFDRLGAEGDLPPSALQPLSDMTSAKAEEARLRWTDLPLDRRQAVIRLAGTLADEHIELNFDRLDLIGLQDPDPVVRRQAVANLWERQDPSLARRFLDLLQTDPDLGVRAEAARALGRFVLALEEDEGGGQDRLPLEETLLSAASADDEQLRLQAVESLGFSSRAEVPAVIQAAYDSAGDPARRSALVAMGRSGDRRWRDIVMAELRSPDPRSRREAAHAAGELALRLSVPELIELLEDVSLEVQSQAVWSLGQIGGKPAERALLRAQRSASDETARIAIQDSLEHITFLEGTRDLEAGVRAWRRSE